MSKFSWNNEDIEVEANLIDKKTGINIVEKINEHTNLLAKIGEFINSLVPKETAEQSNSFTIRDPKSNYTFGEDFVFDINVKIDPFPENCIGRIYKFRTTYFSRTSFLQGRYELTNSSVGFGDYFDNQVLDYHDFPIAAGHFQNGSGDMRYNVIIFVPKFTKTRDDANGIGFKFQIRMNRDSAEGISSDAGTVGVLYYSSQDIMSIPELIPKLE